jgi:hypothetical protein
MVDFSCAVGRQAINSSGTPGCGQRAQQPVGETDLTATGARHLDESFRHRMQRLVVSEHAGGPTADRHPDETLGTAVIGIVEAFGRRRQEGRHAVEQQIGKAEWCRRVGGIDRAAAQTAITPSPGSANLPLGRQAANAIISVALASIRSNG